MTTETEPPIARRALAVPIVALVGGVVLAAALGYAGRPWAAVLAFGVMVIYAALVWFGSRDGDREVVALLGGRHDDERRELIGVRASAHAGYAVLGAVLGAWVWDLAQGGDGAPWFALAALSGVSFVISLAVQSHRR